MFRAHIARTIMPLIVVIVFFGALAHAAPLSYIQPTQIPVRMYRLNLDGSLYKPNQTPFPCATPGNREYWGCTAFDQARTKGNEVVVPYPYGATQRPQVAVESDYLPDVAAQEMEVDPAHPLALQAQIIAARSYGFYKNLTPGPGTPTPTPMDNSASNQVFIPYRFEALRLEGGDYAHNPLTTPTPNPLDCNTIPGDNAARYQRKLCQALTAVQGVYLSYGGDTPIFAEYSADAYLQTQPGDKPYLKAVEDPISYDPAIPGIGAHQRGLSQHGAGRWARGSSSYRPGVGTPWSVHWGDNRQILTHYYTSIHIRDANSTRLTPDWRWVPLSVTWSGNCPPIMYAQAKLPSFPILDTNLRFFGGLGFGLGLILLWSVVGLERQTEIAWRKSCST